MSVRTLVSSIIFFAFLVGIAPGQVTSSNIVGVVADRSGAVVPNVKVELASSTATVRTANTADDGSFRFNNLIPGEYSLTINAKGFKGYTEQSIKLESSTTRDLGRIQLDLGNVTESISVTAQSSTVQTASSEKAYVVDQNQFEAIALKGRDVAGMLQTLPGITGAGGGDTSGVNAFSGISINGGVGRKNITFDGAMVIDQGNGGSVIYEPNMDTVAEIRVLASNYQAEYGRNSGGTISVITKGGGPKFHGSLWWAHRNEEFNANSFFNNRSTPYVPRALYRYNVPGFSFGGPAYLPHVMPTVVKNKLFFFASQEYTRQHSNTATQYYKVPTVAERQGDFSGATDANGVRLPITDPLNNNAPFAGNVVAPSRISQQGLAMLNFFPTPNYVETNPNFLYSRNYSNTATPDHPRRNDTLRMDFNPTSKLTGYYRYGHDYDFTKNLSGNYGLVDSTGNRSTYFQNLDNSGDNHAVGLTYTLNPSTVSELVVGKTYTQWLWAFTDPAQVSRDKMGTPPHFYDASALEKLLNPKDPYNMYAEYAPGVQFNGGLLPSPISFGIVSTFDGEPRTAIGKSWTANESISHVMRSHSLKAGVYFEHTEKIQGVAGFYNGQYSYGAAANAGTASLDTGDGYTNALLGYVQQYQEGTRTNYDLTYNQTEFYLQDTWKASKRLTLDVGVRLYMMPPWADDANTSAAFYPSMWQASTAPRLYTYGKDATGKRVAVDPLNPNNVKPAAYGGLYVQDASGKVIGDPGDGFARQGQNGAPWSLYTSRPLVPAFRLGYAWDISGNGKTALRGGIGQFFDRSDQNGVRESGLPPVAYIPSLYGTNISSLLTAGQALGPTASQTFTSGDQKIPGSINGSFGAQRDIGFGTVLDASYVFSMGRHLRWTYDVNHTALFSQYNPANADPTNPSVVLPAAFYGPYTGLGAMLSSQDAGSSNYNALQVSANRRLSHGLQFGLAYTFAKTIATTTPSYNFPTSSRNRVNGANPPHVVVVNYSYNVPGLGKKYNNKFLGAFTDRWVLSGITTLSSGSWNTASFSYNKTVNQTGTLVDTARINVLSNPNMSSSDKTFFQQFNLNAFAPPAPCKSPTTGALTLTMACFGNGGQNYLLGPGWTNWDMTLAKQIPVGLGEKRFLQLRIEAYNVWNHAEFNAMNTAAQYDLTGTRITTGNAGLFGQLTGTRNPRQMAATLRFTF